MELYLSVDVEADGPIPGVNSMLSFGAAVFNDQKQLISTFSSNLELLPGATPDPETSEWWKGHPEAYAATREDTQSPLSAMTEFETWCRQNFQEQLVFVGYPASYDFMFLYWYFHRFLGRMPPFGFNALDIKTMAMGLLNLPFKKTVKASMPKDWFDPNPHTHIALDDAIEQGRLFCNMLEAQRSMHRKLLGPAIPENPIKVTDGIPVDDKPSFFQHEFGPATKGLMMANEKALRGVELALVTLARHIRNR